MSRKFFLFGFVLAAALLYFSFPAEAQTLSLNIQDQPSGSATARIFNLILLITVLSIAPSLLVMMTSFTRIVVVFFDYAQRAGDQLDAAEYGAALAGFVPDHVHYGADV